MVANLRSNAGKTSTFVRWRIKKLIKDEDASWWASNEDELIKNNKKKWKTFNESSSSMIINQVVET